MLPSKNWLGTISFKFEQNGINGLAFTGCSTVHIVVQWTSSLSDLFHGTAYTALLPLPTNSSNTPADWVAADELNLHLIELDDLWYFLCSRHNTTYSPTSFSRCRWWLHLVCLFVQKIARLCWDSYLCLIWVAYLYARVLKLDTWTDSTVS